MYLFIYLGGGRNARTHQSPDGHEAILRAQEDGEEQSHRRDLLGYRERVDHVRQSVQLSGYAGGKFQRSTVPCNAHGCMDAHGCMVGARQKRGR